MNKGQSGTDTFWRQALFCTRVNWKALASLTKNIPGKNCSKKLGPAPKEKERNDQAQILSLRKEGFKIRKGQVIKDYKKAKYSNSLVRYLASRGKEKAARRPYERQG